MEKGLVIYTIGYSGFLNDTKAFVDELKKRSINVLIDVRSDPYSAKFNNFNKDIFSQKLNENGIIYRNYAEQFGAKQLNRQYYSRFDGECDRIDYEIFINSGTFKDGVTKIQKMFSLGYTPAIMCSEKDPINCHRAIMISNALVNKYDLSVYHIIPGEIDENHKDLERRIIATVSANVLKKKKTNILEQKLKDELFKKTSIFSHDVDVEYLGDIQNYYRIINSKIGWVYDEVNKRKETLYD